MHRAEAADDVYRAIADPTRRAILDRLRAGPVTASKIATGFRQSRPAVSKHLRILYGAGLVREEKRGRERIYHLDASGLAEAAHWLEPYRAFWAENLNALKRYVEENP